MVRDMLSSVASAATSSDLAMDGLQRRPQTACACVQPVAMVSRCPDSSDEESDGAEFDEDDALTKPSTRLESGPSSNGRVAECNVLDLDAEREAAAPMRTQDLLTHDEWLLLGGGWREASPQFSSGDGGIGPRHDESEVSTVLPPSVSSTADARPPSSAGSAQQGAPAAGAETKLFAADRFGNKFPKQCAFIGGAGGVSQAARPGSRQGGGYPGGMRPNAAKLSSHNSWATFLPMRAPGGLQPAPAASGVRLRPRTGEKVVATVAEAGNSSDVVGSVHEASTASRGSAPAVVSPAPAVQANSDPGVSGAAAQEAPPEEPKKKRGPKYQVVPGGSRPAKKAPAHEFLVVEFRTEPRVVPDRKKSQANQAKHAFRPDSRSWAIDRKALAAGSG